MMSLVAVLEQANPGDRILLSAYGNGCDTFILTTTELITKAKGRIGMRRTSPKRHNIQLQ